MNSVIAKRSIVIKGHKTNISVEDQFWSALKEIATERRLTLSELVTSVDHDRGDLRNLSSALRTFVLARYRPAPAPVGSRPRTETGHGIAPSGAVRASRRADRIAFGLRRRARSADLS